MRLALVVNLPAVRGQSEVAKLRHGLLAKPKRPWSAKDSGAFFIKFYLCTTFFSVLLNHTLLGNTRLPKECALQDAGVGLCAAGSQANSSRQCTLLAAHRSSSYFTQPVPAGGTASSTQDCPSTVGYPACVCSVACGPFTQAVDGYAPLADAMKASPFLGLLYTAAETRLVLWVSLAAAITAAFFLGNSLHVVEDMAAEKESHLNGLLASLERKGARQTRKIQVLEMAAKA